ncbi:MAG TPA: NTP transferase domain-containing protein [Dehalococcoidia bacterium]|nr:NTP transferase domain-containing protein [Dehalococcoidia bacterium]
MKQAVILAAGEGNRLRPFTASKPKAMLTIAGKPILEHVIEALAGSGVRSIVLVVGYRREQIFDYFGSGEQSGVEITYVKQERRLGTAHALLQAKGVVADEFLVLSGDKLISADTIAGFVAVEPEAVLVKRVDNPTRYGVVTIEDDLVREITEQPKVAESSLISTRIYALSREVLNVIDARLAISDALNAMIAQGRPLRAYETDGTWLDIVYPWDILSLNGLILRQINPEMGGVIEKGVSLRGLVSVGKNTVIRANSSIVGPVVIGDGCHIGPHVCILPATSIGDNVVLAPLTEVENSVIGSDVTIGAGSIIQDSVIDQGSVIAGHFTAAAGEAEVRINDEHHSLKVGAMLGEGCNIGSGVVAQPGVILGSHSRVKALRLISGRLPDRSLVF